MERVMTLEAPTPGRLDGGLAEDRDEIVVPWVVRGVQVFLEPVDQSDLFLFLEALRAKQKESIFVTGSALFLGQLLKGIPERLGQLGKKCQTPRVSFSKE